MRSRCGGASAAPAAGRGSPSAPAPRSGSARFFSAPAGRTPPPFPCGGAGSLIVLGLFLLGRGWLNRARFSWRGALLILLGLPVWIGTAEIVVPMGWPAMVRVAPFDLMVARIDRRRPGLITALRDGQRPDLPARSTWGPLHTVEQDGGLVLRGNYADDPVADRVAAEGLRFALAQRAWLAGDRATVRRLLPLGLSLTEQDQNAVNDFGARIVALERFADR